MTRFFDASAWVKRYLDEEGSDQVCAWAQPEENAVSRLSEVEVASPILRRLRDRTLPLSACEHMLSRLDADLQAATVIELTAAVTRMAQGIMRRHPLRVGDAVQLASALYLQQALAAPVEFICFDQRLNAAARSEGLLTPAAS